MKRVMFEPLSTTVNLHSKDVGRGPGTCERASAVGMDADN